MSYWCFVAVGSLALIVLIYGLFEFHYFLRMCLCVILARFVKRKCYILEPTIVSAICLTNDIDALLYHMNNARFLRELDFARVDFYERTNLYRTIRSKGGSVFQGAATIRYRRFIRPFQRFQIVSRITFWDNQSIYMEHRFIRPNDNFVHAIAMCRQRFIDCSAEDVMQELLSPKIAQTSTTSTTQTATTTTTTTTATTTHNMQYNSTICVESNFGTTSCQEEAENRQIHVKLKPDIPAELVKWIEYNDLSSKSLRPS